MNRIFETALAVQTFCDSQGWSSCLIGGVAVQRWAEVRVTRDVDLSLLTGFGREEPFVDALLAEYAARNAEPRGFALKNRVVLLVSKRGVGIKEDPQIMQTFHRIRSAKYTSW